MDNIENTPPTLPPLRKPVTTTLTQEQINEKRRFIMGKSSSVKQNDSSLLQEPSSDNSAPRLKPLKVPSKPFNEQENIGVHKNNTTPLVEYDEWDDNPENDPTIGLGSEAPSPEDKPSVRRRGRKQFVLTERDLEIVRLLGRFRYGSRRQIERYFNRKDLSRRLTQLKSAGFLRQETITSTQSIWTPTLTGLDRVDLDIPEVQKGKISFSGIPHTIGLLSIATDLELGYVNEQGMNAIGELNSDHQWRKFYNVRTRNYEGYVEGETILSERIIMASYNRAKALYGIETMRKTYREAMERPISEGQWGPESEEGNEWFFRIEGSANRMHMPDLVIVRPRRANGASGNIAIELEISPKPVNDWTRILTMFKNSPSYRSVIYFTHKRTISNNLSIIAQKVKLDNTEFAIKKYVPKDDSLVFWG